jgi:IclR family KDG regulon transcriptional repressor
MKREKANYMIQSVSHAIDVLEELAKSGGEVGVTELSKRLKLHKNNVFRLLATLELRGYVEQNKDSESYRLGVKALQLGQAYHAQNSLVARALPVLRQLADSTGETASLAILQSGQVQYPVSIESKRPVRVNARIAVSFSAKANAAGRLLTANLPDSVLNEILATNTPQDAAIRSQMADLRSHGVIIDRGAIEPDVVSIAKIVRGSHNEVVGALELLAPQYRVKLEDSVAQLDEAAQRLSAALGAGRTTLAGGVEKEISARPEAVAARLK